MKVLHIITRMNTGGPAVFLDHLTNAMADLKVESIIAYGYCESNESDYVENHKFSSKIIKIQSLHRSLNPVDDVRSYFQIRRIIKQIKPDLVNTHTSKAGVLGRIAAKSVNKSLPVVHTFHGHLIYGYFARYKSWLFTLIEKTMSRYTNASVAVTNETKTSLIGLGIGKKTLWQVIQIGIPGNIKPTSQLSGGGKLNLLWVGRFTEIKDPAFAIEVISSVLKNSSVDISLTMVGEGELFEKIKAGSYGLPITFTGWLNKPFETISDFDLLLITSKNEGLPLVMLEAASYGRATISTDVGGVSEFIQSTLNGYLVSGDANEMAEQLIAISTDKTSLAKIGENAKNLLHQKFSVTEMARGYQELYNRLIIRS